MRESDNICHLPITPFSGTAGEYLEALLEADRVKAELIIKKALENGLSIRELYLGIFQPVQQEVGHLWLINKLSVAEEHFCTAATQAIMTGLYPEIISSKRIGKTFVAVCVASELHEIGVRMVADFFEMEGWDTYYLGSGLQLEQIISAIEQRKPDLFGISVTMTYHIDKVKELIFAIKNRFAEKSPRIMVGGIPFNSTTGLWQTVGADIFASDAAEAVNIATKEIKH